MITNPKTKQRLISTEEVYNGLGTIKINNVILRRVVCDVAPLMPSTKIERGCKADEIVKPDIHVSLFLSEGKSISPFRKK